METTGRVKNKKKNVHCLGIMFISRRQKTVGGEGKGPRTILIIIITQSTTARWYNDNNNK